MSTYRKLPAELDGRFVAALVELPVKTLNWRQLRQRRGKPPWMSLILSAVAHVVVMLAVSAAAVVTVELAQVSMLVAEISAEPEEVPLESLATMDDSAADDGPDPSEAGTLIASTEAGEQLELADVPPVEFPLADMLPPTLVELPTDDILQEVPTEDETNTRQVTSSRRQADKQEEPRPPAAEYFGTVARGDRFVYVLDSSGSMSGNRFGRAVAELLRSLDQLKPDQLFYVVLFSSEMQRMFNDANRSPRMLPATLANRQRLRKWLHSVEAGGGTEPKRAIQFAISLRPSAVFLLSDGAFNGMTTRTDLFGADSPAGQLVDGRQAVPIHSFAYEDPSAKNNMQTLAALTGGQYRYVKPRPAPPTPVASAPAAPHPGAAPNRGAARPKTTLAQQKALTPRQRADAMLKDADKLRDEGNHNEAARAYRNLVNQYPMTSAGAKARGRLVQLWNAARTGRR